MSAGPTQSNSKWHSPAPTIHAAPITNTQMNISGGSKTIQTGIEGEDRNLPGQRSAQFLTQDYGMQRHEAYDSQFAQPAYSGHGKVQVGKTSDL
jgi:hypothetical protein